MHQSAVSHPRKERVRQSREREKSVLDYSSYVPIGDASAKLQHWKQQGVKIVYFSSHELKEDVKNDESVLTRYNFPKGDVYFRQKGEKYQDITERVMPDILIEDNCESIGGVKEMVYPSLRPELKKKIKSIVVKEFEGIDHLPDSVHDLQNFQLLSFGN